MSERTDDAAPAGPSFRSQVWFWLGALAILIAALYVFSSILLPFVAGMALAYLLDPVADWFERRGFSRLAATFLILVLFLILFVLLLVALVPALIDQLFGLIEGLPDLVARLQEMLQPLLEGDLAESLGIDSEQIRSSLLSFVDEGATWMLTILGSIWDGGVALLGILSLLVVTPVVAFYLLYDWDRMIGRVDSWLPRQHAGTIRELGGQMSRAIAGFVR